MEVRVFVLVWNTFLFCNKYLTNTYGFPQVVLTKDTTLKKARLREIVSSYFQLDVATLADFSDTASLRDLLLLLTQRVGQKVNVSNLANTLGIREVNLRIVWWWIWVMNQMWPIIVADKGKLFENAMALLADKLQVVISINHLIARVMISLQPRLRSLGFFPIRPLKLKACQLTTRLFY